MILIFLLFSLCVAYDQSLSKHFINLSQATYCVSSTKEWNCITCESSIKPEYLVENNGARAIQGFDTQTNTLFVAFRGSSNIQNWIDNIQISKISPYNESSIEVEKGFYKAYNYLHKKFKIPIIEDACHAILAKRYQKYAGNFGRFGCFSLHPLKNLNVWGDGGFVLLKNKKDYKKMSLYVLNKFKNDCKI